MQKKTWKVFLLCSMMNDESNRFWAVFYLCLMEPSVMILYMQSINQYSLTVKMSGQRTFIFCDKLAFITWQVKVGDIASSFCHMIQNHIGHMNSLCECWYCVHWNHCRSCSSCHRFHKHILVLYLHHFHDVCPHCPGVITNHYCYPKRRGIGHSCWVVFQLCPGKNCVRALHHYGRLGNLHSWMLSHRHHKCVWYF